MTKIKMVTFPNADRQITYGGMMQNGLFTLRSSSAPLKTTQATTGD